MIKFTYVDGQTICVCDGEKIKKYESGYIQSYIRNAESLRRSSEWKKSGEGALFRGDVTYKSNSEQSVESSINGVYPTADDDWIVYSFTVNEASGIYKKNLSDDKTPETHVINSHETSFGGGMLDCAKRALAVSVRRGYYNADIGIFDLNGDDYKLVTDGDTFDEDPYISPDDGDVIYFSSRGVGRDGHGEFVEYAPSVICRLDLGAMSVEEVAASPKYSYFKPVYHGGKLYAIKAPSKVKRGNAFIEFLLFPWRILQAIASFINIFVTATTGKGLTEGGGNPARRRDYDSRKIEIAGNLIDVDKQAKKNASKKDGDFGFIPKSWQLVEVESGKVIKNGVCDYDIDEDGTIIATNGRRIFEIKDGKCRKICNADFCLRVNCKHGSDSKSEESPFGF